MNENVFQSFFQVPAPLRASWTGDAPSKVASDCGRTYAVWLDAMEHVTLKTLQSRSTLASAQIDCLACTVGGAELSGSLHTLARNWFELRGNAWRNWFSLMRSMPGIGTDLDSTEQESTASARAEKATRRKPGPNEDLAA